MLTQKTHIYFAGIGGIGMSALAGICKKRGHIISGSDSNIEQKSIHKLIQLGCSITRQNEAFLANPKPDLLIYSTAISNNTPIMREALALGIRTIHRAELLSELTKQQKTIAITGAHGKTTTASMISHLFISAHQDPTVVLGGFLESIDSNYLAGTGEWLIAEADESDRSMLKLHPNMIVITNIDNEHLDTYKDADDMQAAFYQFLQTLHPHGNAIIFIDTPQTKNLIASALSNIRARITTYGRSPEADFRITNEQFTSSKSSAEIITPGNGTIAIQISQSGPHMIENASAALISGYICGLSGQQCTEALASFSGVEQRFTYRGTYRNAHIIDDYAHHPTEIAHALGTAQRYNPTKLIVVFQPQRYSRTQALWNEFIEVFSKAAIDNLFITDIYSASEKMQDPNKNAAQLVREINTIRNDQRAAYIPQDQGFGSVKKSIDECIVPGSLILFLGAGKVNALAHELARADHI
ncbi:MAG: UDP-N-acetylmuramate-L-alanine ligase [candidate division TM6 bacterium GW2011_GWF2_43_17]|nr:MAG: UDP-N-acetylmuramate-L-alanine ligase [candidate division TM6 bacterium GW2011_GWF2_43_17]HAU30158.1 UDP-N-acetylmuramate--L-alanine ligase [Candidatus Dependentiae bacterium]